MKNNLKYFLPAGLIAIMAISSCTKKLDEAYENPNAPKRVPVEQLLPSMIGSITGSSSAAGSAYGLAADGLLIGRYIQFWGTYSTTSSPVSATAANATNYDQMAGTVGVSDNLGSVWAAHYYGMGQNLNRIIEWGTEEEKWDYVGAAQALRAWSMFEAVNEYGELIVRQAFDVNRQQFEYDPMPLVYDSVRAFCYRALENLSKTGGNMNPANFANSDLFFNQGSLDRWKKFVYGILARSYLNVIHKTGALFDYRDSTIKYASLSCASNNDNVTCKFQNTGITGTSNYFGNLRQNVNSATFGIRQSAFIADLMSGDTTNSGPNPPYGYFFTVSDPRLWYMLRENTLTSGRIFRGITPWLGATGLATAQQPGNFMGGIFSSTAYPSPQQGRYIFRDEAEWPVMTASEMQFILAEAYLRKSQPALAHTHYVNGISLHFDMLSTKYATNIPAGREITTINKAAYLANPIIVPSVANLNLTRIMLQKYIAMYAWGTQTVWNDMRRYHYTDLDPATGAQVYYGFQPPSGTSLHASNLGKLVYRCRPRYNSEYLYNIPALTAIGAFPVGNDYHTRRVWFCEP